MSTHEELGRNLLGMEATRPATVQDAAQEEPEERTLAGHQVRVTLERPGGAVEVLVVRVDNRDFVRWDMTAPRQKWGSAKEVPFLFQTFLAWSAGKRAGHDVGPFEAFRDQVLEAKDLEDDAARPTQ